MLPGRNYTPEEILRIVWHRKWILIVATVIFAGAAYAVALRLPNQYRSETLILVIPQRIPDSYVHSSVTIRIEDRLRSISQEILSRSRLERVIDEFGLYPELRKKLPIEVVVEQMRANINVETVRDDAFRVSYVALVPRTAMIVTDRLASMFIDANTTDRSVMAEGTNRFLESQLDDARTRLVNHEKKLEEFRRRYSGELPSQLQTNLQVIQGNESQIQGLSESINRDRDRRLVLERSIADALAADAPAGGTIDTAAPGDSSTINESRAIDQLERARNDLRGMQLRLKPEHPDVVAKKRLIAELERKMQQEASGSPTASATPVSTTELIRQARARQYQVEVDKLDRQIAVKEGEMDRLRKAVTDVQRRVDAVPGHESEQTDLMRDYETLQKIYSSLLAKKEDSKISANLERQQVSEQFKVLDPAKQPERPFSPKRTQIAGVAGALGLVFGIAFAAFLEHRNMALRTEEEIVRVLVLPVIAAIPIMTSVTERARRRRLVIATVAATILLVAGLTTASLVHFGVLSGLR